MPRRNGKHIAPTKVEQVPVKPVGLGGRSRNLLDALQLHHRQVRIVDSALAPLEKLPTKAQ